MLSSHDQDGFNQTKDVSISVNLRLLHNQSEVPLPECYSAVTIQLTRLVIKPHSDHQQFSVH